MPNRREHLPALLESVGERMWAAFQDDLLPHSGELGADREEVVRAFFRRHLPHRFEVEPGFIFDSSGDVSRQMDVIIFDRLAGPRLETAGGRLFVPCEIAVCAGEVKSRVTSSQVAASAFRNLRSAKRLDRTAGGESHDWLEGFPLDPETEHLDQLFTFLFVIGPSLRRETMLVALQRETGENPRHHWPNVVFSFDRYMLTYCCEDGICPNPLHARGISMVEPPRERLLLLEFFLVVARAVMATSVASFPYIEHLRTAAEIGGPVFPFGESEA